MKSETSAGISLRENPNLLPIIQLSEVTLWQLL